MISVGFKAIPCRLVIIFSIFVLTCTNYMMRVNLSVNLVAMVPLTNNTVSPSQVVLNWSVFERAQVLGSFYWGYLAGAFINIIIQEWFGARLLIISTSFINSLLTLLSPLAAKHSYLALVVLRTLMGILTGPQFPSYFRLISKWALDHERTKFGSVPMVGTIGTFFAWMTCGPIISRFGWEWGFYVYGIIGLGITVLSYFTIYDSPEDHPRISSSELSYIKEGIKDNKIKPKKFPYLQMLTSIPVWAYIVVEFGQGWIIYTILNTAPHYLASALHYSTSATSMLSSLTYLVRCTLSIVFGYLGDYLLNKHFTSLETLRKCGSLASHIVPGCIALCMTIQGLESAFYVILIIMSLGFNAASVLSNNLNPLYLSKNYIGTLYALSTVVSSVSGTFIPLVTATFVQGDETNPIVWRPVFYTAAAIYIISSVIFIIFGSMETQKWNHYDEDETKEQTNMTVNKDNPGAA